MSLRTSRFMGGTTEAAGAELEWIRSAGVAPVQQRSTWPDADPANVWALLAAHTESGSLRGALGVRSYPLRSLPGFRALTAAKFGHGLSEELVDVFVEAIRRWGDSDARVVRVNLEAFSAEPGGLERIEAVARDHGFSRLATTREYSRTLLVDLSGGADAVEGRIHRMVLKNVRRTERAGHVVLPIIDERFAPRMAALLQETMGRTGARAQPHDWRRIIRTSREHPDSHRLVGLFRGGEQTPEALMAYRWCGCSGDFADDLLAASTRQDSSYGKVPMMPAIMLDVLRWAADRGASWFDFGGVVEPDDPRYGKLGSITEFKRLFGSDVRTVGMDLIYEPRPFLSGVSRTISRLRRTLPGR